MVEARYDISQICTVRWILELVFIRSGYLEFSDTSNSSLHVFLHAKLRLLISFFVPVNFYSLILCVLCARFL